MASVAVPGALGTPGPGPGPRVPVPASLQWMGASGKSQSFSGLSFPFRKVGVWLGQVLKLCSQVGTLGLTRGRQRSAQTCSVSLLARDLGFSRCPMARPWGYRPWTDAPRNLGSSGTLTPNMVMPGLPSHSMESTPHAEKKEVLRELRVELPPP